MDKQNKKEDAPVEQVHYIYSVPVRFENAGKPYSFGTMNPNIQKGDSVVVETQQGLELGITEGGSLEIEKFSLRMPTRGVVRVATARDLSDFEENKEYDKEAYKICDAEIKDLKLEMNLLSARYTLDRSKVLFVYISDQRVDFRELLKRLGAKLHCRIELRQIGERDKAKMVGGIGMCGMECCCRRFKTKFDVISINMAKDQLLALNIEKLSGMCGKLMCCLKYEDNDYKEMISGLPKMGSQVEYEGEIYRITNMNVMSNQAKLENRENAVFLTLEDLRTKAIPRKGVVVAHKNTDGKPARKNIINTITGHSTAPAYSSSRSSSHTPAEHKRDENTKTDVRSFSRKDREKDNAPKGNIEKRTFSRKDKSGERPHVHTNARKPEPKPQGNVTIRTFGRKKKEEGEGK